MHGHMVIGVYQASVELLCVCRLCRALVLCSVYLPNLIQDGHSRVLIQDSRMKGLGG